jgi:hypothetical protein
MPSQGPSTLPCHPCRCRHSLPLLLLLLLCRLTTAFLSAFLDNVTTILLMAPVTISLMRQCNTDPVPLLLAQVRTQSIPTLARQTAWAGAAQRSAVQMVGGSRGVAAVLPGRRCFLVSALASISHFWCLTH